MDNEINLDEIGYIENGILIVRDGVTEIPDGSFKNRGLIGVKLPESVIEIGYHAFADNQIKEIELPSRLKIILPSAFQSNQITKLIIPPELKTLDRLVFANNQLTNVIIPSNIITIGLAPLSCDTLTSVDIPATVKNISYGAFPAHTQIIYDGTKIDKELINKFGTDSIIMIYKILKVMPDFNFNLVSKDILDVFPSETDMDFLKSYITNGKKFNLIMKQLKEKYSDIKKNELQDIFKMFYTLGFFKTGGERQEFVLTEILKIIDYYGIDGIHQIFTSIHLTKFQPKFAEVVLSEYQHPKLGEVISRFYSECDEMVPIIRKKKENKIGLLNTRQNNATDEVTKKALQEKLENFKRNKNNIFVDDIITYTMEQVFKIREGNEELYSIIQQLAPYIKQEQFDRIQDIYEKAIYIEKSGNKYFQNVSDTEQGDVHYFWSPGNNPTNIILGYLCNCCAKYGGAGEDIMIQSMINPQIKNLIIYDGVRNVIGKSTAFYHHLDKYIVFNNIEIAHWAVKLEKGDKILDAILRGIHNQISAMIQNGYEIKEVRIGMLRNDLAEEIEKRKLRIEHDNLLANYDYANYSGDANDKCRGQAIIDIQSERQR